MTYKLRDWIPLDKLNWQNLSLNPNAIDLLRENPHRIHWQNLSLNPNAIDLLRENPDRIDWDYLSRNPNIFIKTDACVRTIQTAFRKSRGYAEWAGHPDRLKAHGFFDLEV
jgi:uncharacterized protein YlzI (FlbEa/FlbD family)